MTAYEPRRRAEETKLSQLPVAAVGGQRKQSKPRQGSGPDPIGSDDHAMYPEGKVRPSISELPGGTLPGRFNDPDRLDLTFHPVFVRRSL